MENMFVLNNIRKTYDAKITSRPALVIEEEFSIPKGKVVAIAGYSGSGKSTLLNVLGMLDHPDNIQDCRMEIMGKELSFTKRNKRWKFSQNGMDFMQFRREHLGFIFQNTFLPRSLRVYQAFMFSNGIKGLSPENENIKKALREVGLSYEVKNKNLANARVNALSGGQLQRVAIAVAMSKNPDIILADEPTSSLDFTSGKEVLTLLHDWVRQGGTLVWVSHNLYQVEQYADIIHVMIDGRIQKTIDNEQKATTENEKFKLVETLEDLLKNAE